jgi:hypothetical protein
MNKKYIILAFTPSSLKNNYLWIKCKRYKLFDKKRFFLFGVYIPAHVPPSKQSFVIFI